MYTYNYDRCYLYTILNGCFFSIRLFMSCVICIGQNLKKLLILIDFFFYFFLTAIYRLLCTLFD